MYNLGQMLQDPDARQRLVRHVAGCESEVTLRCLKIKVTSQCNLRCTMCRYWRIDNEQLPRPALSAALASAASLGCRKVHFSGGEVTLYHDLVALIEQGSRLGMRVNLTTNGILMDKERARQWIDAGLRSASFSIDGVDPKSHDRIRGMNGAFKRTVRAIRILRRESERRHAKLSIRINCVISRHNLRDLPGLIRLAGELGAVDVLPMPVDGKRAERPLQREIDAFNRELVPEIQQLRRCYGMPINFGRIYPFGRRKEERQLASRGKYALGYYEHNLCYAPYLHTFVSHTGSVYACCMTRDRIRPLGNILTDSLAEIFRGEPYCRLRRSMQDKRLPICALCDQFLQENRLVKSRLAEYEIPAAVTRITELKE